ncbi:MAG: 2-oxoglutarate dehydrogenase E1 component, partial [Syntrophobacteraceae bacterium CG07_land_8_20_14_0_80_61_8]
RGATCRPPEAHFHDLGNPPAGTGTGTDADADVTDRTVTTAVSKDRLLEIAATLFTAKPGFTIHRKLERILLRRLETVRAGAGIDWSNAELLAFGSLVTEGTPVRLSGQDSRRGTFSQRHSVLTDAVSGAHDTPLNRLAPDQAPFQVFDSALSENAVLGFEYGYSLTAPESLVLWEAQFGDFANNAQVIIDQYIAAAEAKWRRPSALALLLPHGFEGQGPEHSSARLERYLQLCAEDNLQVCVPSTPAQYFHLLRRQAKQGKPKPLIVLTPKSLLRHPLAVSRLDELIDGAFQPVITDPEPPPKVRRLLWCSGKIYYDLLARRREQSEPDAAIVRIEQLYPLRPEQLQAAAARFPTAEEFCWVQEEPRNMGAWRHVSELFAQVFDRPLRYLGRPPAASPATGYAHVHKAEQGKILDAALHQVVQDP